MTRTLEVYSLSNFQICSAVLLTEAPMPYISSPRPIYFLTGNLYLLTPLINFVYSLLSLASGKSPICSIYLWDCLFIYFCVSALEKEMATHSSILAWRIPWTNLVGYNSWVHMVPHVRDSIWYLSFSICVISLSLIPSRFIHVVTNGKILFLFKAE